MADKETIMTWLKKCGNGGCSLRCPYDDLGLDKCYETLMTDALNLLKEPEPVKVIIHGEDEWYGFYAQCPECACEWMMDHEELKYCPHCRKPVKWDG